MEYEDVPTDACGIDIVIQPPGDGVLSDAESGDDEEPDINRLSKEQLKAESEVTIQFHHDLPDEQTCETKTKTKKKTNWKKGTIDPIDIDVKHYQNPTTVEKNCRDPMDYFDLFFDSDVILISFSK